MDWVDILGQSPTQQDGYVIIKTKTKLELDGIGYAFYNPNDTEFWQKVTKGNITPKRWINVLLGTDTEVVPMSDLATLLKYLEKLPPNQKIAILDHGAFDSKTGDVFPKVGNDLVVTNEQWKVFSAGVAKVAKEVVFCGCKMGRGPDEAIEPGSKQNMDRLANLCELGPLVVASNVINMADMVGLQKDGTFTPRLDTTNLAMEASWFRIEKMSQADFKKLPKELREMYLEQKEQEHQILKVEKPARIKP